MKLDKEAVRAAKEELGIKLPVHITVEDQLERESLRGDYSPFVRRLDGHLIHAIRLADHGVRETSETLWHELSHVQDAERLMGPDGDGYCPPEQIRSFQSRATVEELMTPYERQPSEIKARRVAALRREKLLFTEQEEEG